ncbi:MAG: HD-GYP domain-containing protein [Eubacteriales bacterium]
MSNSSLTTKLYIWFIVITAILLLLYLTPVIVLNTLNLKGFLFFAILAVFTDSLPVPLPRGGSVTVTVAVVYASIILFGAAVSAYVMIAAIVFSKLFTRDREPWYKLVFNCAQFVLAAGISGSVYQLLGGENSTVNFNNFLPFIAAAITYLAVNCTAFSLVLSLSQSVSLQSIWLTNMRWAMPNLMMLAPLGLLMAIVYSYTGPLGVTLFFVPLLLARFVFKSYIDTREIFINTLEALASALDAKDNYTKGHSDRVASYATALARHLKMPEDQVEVIQHMAMLHDVGKIGINDELLTRIGALTDEEFGMIKLHPVIGANILNDISYFGAAKEFVKYHHEKYDGTGYPERLQGEKIPYGARIITLADSFDAMTSDRSYRKRVSVEEALWEVRRCAGTHFDPELAEAFIQCWQKTSSPGDYKALLEVATSTDK